MENGLPQNAVQALLQTQDGFLWLGTEAGLVRFDGVQFQTYDRKSDPALPGNDIRCLLQTNDGAFWIGTNAGLARWKDGAVRAYTAADGLPSNLIRSLTQANDGALWVWTGLGVAQLRGDKFVRVTGALAQKADGVVVSEPGGTFLLQAENETGVDRNMGWTDPGRTEDNENVFFAPLSDGNAARGSKSMVEILRTEPSARHQSNVLSRLKVGSELPGVRVQAMLADHRGALWIGTNAGLVRWLNGKVEHFPAGDPLSTASILVLTEDREGDLWIGTETEGLQVLRDQRFAILDTRQGLSSSRITTVMGDGAGTIWAGTQEDGVNVLSRKGTEWRTARVFTTKDGLSSDVILSLAFAPNRDLWVGTPDGLNRIRGQQVQVFTSGDGLPDDFVRSLLIDTDGSLWVGTRRGLAHLFPKGRDSVQIETYTHANGLGNDLVGAMARDVNGDLWIATLAGLSRLHHGSISNFTITDGLSSNVVTALLPRADGTVLIGTQDHGWNEWDRHTFSAKHDSLEHTTIHAIVDDSHSHLWFSAGDGIARCDYSSAGKADCSKEIQFGIAGMLGRGGTNSGHPSAWRSPEGHLWLATSKGLVDIDTGKFPVNTLVPPVALERFQVDDVSQPLSIGEFPFKVRAGHVHFEFDYAGLSFVAPQKIRYRYILEGFDREWTDAGARRAAYYTNIPPGRYTFKVQAANNDGVWNTAGTAFSFELRPHYYQTAWFYVLLFASALATVLLLFKQHARRTERGFQVVLAERARIAREIHDTLAQGYAGVSIQLEVLSELLQHHREADAAEQLDNTRKYVREGLADARQSIWALRTQDASENTLPVRLRRIAESANSGVLTARFTLFGAYRALPAETEQEVVRVAQEAIHNVKKHSGASLVSVELEYRAQVIALEVRDDGRGGISEAVTGAQEGHFGLMGMKERAAAIGGTLAIDSVPDGGTTIRLYVPTRFDAREGTRSQE